MKQVTRALAIAIVLILAAALPVSAQADEVLYEIHDDAVIGDTLRQPDARRAPLMPDCVSRTFPAEPRYDPETGEQIGWYSGSVDPCHWQVLCVVYRVDDWELDPVLAEFLAEPFPFFDIDDFDDQALLLDYCRLVSHDNRMLLRSDGIAIPELAVHSNPGVLLVPIIDEVLDVPGTTLLDLWAAIPVPTIEIDGAPPIREQTWVQASTWVWIEEIETPLQAVSISPAGTARAAVQAKVARIEWDFGDGVSMTCEEDRLVVWDDSLDPYADAGVGCTHIYQQVSSEGFTVVANVNFEGEWVLQSKAAASLDWPPPAWLPYAETRIVPGDLLVQVFEIAARN